MTCHRCGHDMDGMGGMCSKGWCRCVCTDPVTEEEMATRKRRLNDRLTRNRELGARDAANRCAYCKAPFTGVIIESFLTGGKFCSDECLKAVDEQRILSQRHP